MSRLWGDDPRDLAALDAWITREPDWRTEGPCTTPGCDGVDDIGDGYCDACRAMHEADGCNDCNDTKGTTTMNTTANDNNPSTTATLDVVLSITAATQPGYRWALEGWASHLRGSRHQNHAASSYAKHAAEFAGYELAARALTIARCVDHGVTAEEASALVDERCAARAAKAGAA